MRGVVGRLFQVTFGGPPLLAKPRREEQAEPACALRKMLQPTFKAFPQDPASKDAAGVPFGCVAQPLAPFANEGEVLAEDEVELADVVARCEGCYGYISSYCTFMRSHWRCSLCGVLLCCEAASSVAAQ